VSKKQDRANSDDVDVVVTMRVTDAGVVVPGSVERTCAMCDAAVWVSPSTLAVFDGRTMPPIWCTPCALTFSRRAAGAPWPHHRRQHQAQRPAARRGGCRVREAAKGAALMGVETRPTHGGLTVPYMVDEATSLIDFKLVDAARVEDCARNGKCGVCGQRIRRGPIAFVGPDDGRRCFSDPWMHQECAALAMQQCPFLRGRRDWRDAEARKTPLLQKYSQGMVVVLARNWRSHQDPAGAWHFEAIGPLTRPEGA